jgi:Secretion system C-terminal sorting domain
MKKILLIIIVALYSINAKSQETQCFTATVVGSNIEFKLTAFQGNFQLQAADMYFTVPASMTMAEIRTTTTLGGVSYNLTFVPQGANEYFFSVVTLGASGLNITNVPSTIGTIPFSGSAGAITLGDITVNKVGSMTTLPPSCSGPLPTELLSFKGNKKGAVSQIQWEATNEKNIVNYIVERSSDGRNFHPLGFTKPKSFNATEKVAYDFIDDSPAIGINYYRLLSKGFGKDEKYSKVISLDFGLGLSGRVYPNPLDTDLTVELDIEDNVGTVDINIYDLTGKQILSKKIQNSDRRVNMTLPTADLPPGTYLVKVKVGTFNWERQITKM